MVYRRSVQFTKAHGTGNDFVVVSDPDGELELDMATVRAICDRRTGVGADGLLRLVRTEACEDPAAIAARGQAQWFMDYRNSDGSSAQMCGNGARVAGRFLVDRQHASSGEFDLATRAGLRRLWVPGAGDVSVDMGPVRRLPAHTVRVLAHTWEAAAVDVGNPHLVVRLADAAELAALPYPLPPPDVTPQPSDGVNVEFVAPERRGGGLTMRVYERGVGETFSCGTGAVAAVAAVLGEPARAVPVRVPGGTLRVRHNGGTFVLTGPVTFVADGELLPGWR